MDYYNVLAGSKYFHGDKPLTYSSDQSLDIGTVVQIPLRNQKVLGIVDEKVSKPDFTTKPITSILVNQPIPSSSVSLLKWIGAYYPSPMGALVSMIVPSFLMKQPKKEKLEINSMDSVLKLPPKLVPHQVEALEKILSQPEGSSILLHGQTGSGKTRVYMEVARKQIERNKNVIVLTPEIGLTTQLVKDFEKVFGDKVLVTHSGLSEAKRRKIWLKALRSTTPLIIIGPRSALYLPINSLGLVVVDEAHEQAYKQEQSPKYNALRVAAKLAYIHKATIIYGSATPSVSEYFNMQIKSNPIVKMSGLATLKSKDTGKTSIVSIKDRSNFSKNKILSDSMIDAISKSLSNHEQSLVFLNRRGTARIVACSVCGWQATCPNCDLPLTYHGDKHTMVCHTCGHNEVAVAICPNCKSTEILFKTAGTKAIVSELTKLFPKARIKRFDTDNLKSESLEQNFSDVLNGNVDILVGTQILGKGLDLPKLSVVGVISADTSLNFPDFTSEERTYQMITQIVGRIGRGHRKGIAIIQTLNPDNKTVVNAVAGNWQEFYDDQIEERKKFGFPPFYHLLKLSYSAKSETTAHKAALELAKSLGGAIEIIGPAPSFFEKRGGLYTWQIVIKAKDRKVLLNIIDNLPGSWHHDIDPANLL